MCNCQGLVRLTQLRMGLHGYETAVRQLREYEWQLRAEKQRAQQYLDVAAVMLLGPTGAPGRGESCEVALKLEFETWLCTGFVPTGQPVPEKIPRNVAQVQVLFRVECFTL